MRGWELHDIGILQSLLICPMTHLGAGWLMLLDHVTNNVLWNDSVDTATCPPPSTVSAKHYTPQLMSLVKIVCQVPPVWSKDSHAGQGPWLPPSAFSHSYYCHTRQSLDQTITFKTCWIYNTFFSYSSIKINELQILHFLLFEWTLHFACCMLHVGGWPYLIIPWVRWWQGPLWLRVYTWGDCGLLSVAGLQYLVPL